MRPGLVIGLALLLAGCVGPDIELRHPATGWVATCDGGYARLLLGGPTNQSGKDRQSACIDDYRRRGYERVPD
jgi:hypothetical protein